MAKPKLVSTETEEQRQERLEQRVERTFNLEPNLKNFIETLANSQDTTEDDIVNVALFQYMWITGQLMMGNKFYLQSIDENGKKSTKLISLLERQITRKIPG